MNKSYDDLDDIKRAVGIIGRDIKKELSKKAKEDLKQAHYDIIYDFYHTHKPSSYNRKYDFYSTILNNKTDVKNGLAFVDIGSDNLEFHNKRISNDSIFDLVWNKGVRGLPEYGTKPLYHPVTVQKKDGAIIKMNAGEVWRNPFWSGNDAPYNNMFTTKVQIGTSGKYTINDNPNNVMLDFVNQWGMTAGAIECDEIVKKKYKNK